MGWSLFTQLCPKGSDIIMLSDFVRYNESNYSLINQIRRHNRVRLVHFYDPLEQGVTAFKGSKQITDGNKTQWFNFFIKQGKEKAQSRHLTGEATTTYANEPFWRSHTVHLSCAQSLMVKYQEFSHESTSRPEPDYYAKRTVMVAFGMGLVSIIITAIVLFTLVFFIIKRRQKNQYAKNEALACFRNSQDFKYLVSECSSRHRSSGSTKLFSTRKSGRLIWWWLVGVLRYAINEAVIL